MFNLYYFRGTHDVWLYHLLIMLFLMLCRSITFFFSMIRMTLYWIVFGDTNLGLVLNMLIIIVIVYKIDNIVKLAFC